MNKKHTNNKGFTLIELAITLAVTAMVLVTFLITYEKNVKSPENITLERIQHIKTELDAFFQRFGRYPCPADITLTSSDAYATSENHNNTDDECILPSDFIIDDGTDHEVYIGAVPTRTLGLTSEQAVDGWDHKIVYAIDTSFIKKTAIDRIGNITVLEDANYSIAQDSQPPPNIRTETANLVLLSYGEDGAGAYTTETASGNSEVTRITPRSSDTNDLQNANHDLLESDWDGVFILPIKQDASSTEIYDDIIIFGEYACTTATDCIADPLEPGRTDWIEAFNAYMEQPTQLASLPTTTHE